MHCECRPRLGKCSSSEPQPEHGPTGRRAARDRRPQRHRPRATTRIVDDHLLRPSAAGENRPGRGDDDDVTRSARGSNSDMREAIRHLSRKLRIVVDYIELPRNRMCRMSVGRTGSHSAVGRRALKDRSSFFGLSSPALCKLHDRAAFQHAVCWSVSINSEEAS